MDQVREVRLGVIYGFYEMSLAGTEIISRWKPSPMLDLTPSEQYKHNVEIDPEFQLIKITPREEMNLTCS